MMLPSSRYVLVVVFVCGCWGTDAWGAVAARNYNFEEGQKGQTTVLLVDSIKDLFFESDADGIWAGGHIWLEVAGATGRPLPAGPLKDVVEEFALADPPLEALDGRGVYEDVSAGTAFDSPAVSSTLAMRFDGETFFDDVDLGSRGVYVDRDAYNNDDEGNDDNRAESFNMISQGWVYPSADGQGTAQTIWQVGSEQGSVNITEDGFWEFRELSSVGILNPGIEVAFDTWTHLGIRRGGNGAEVFINGQHVDGDINPNPPNWFGGFATRISLGGRVEEEDLLDGFIGLVDDFKIMGTADLGWDPTIDLDFFKTDDPDPTCVPVNNLLGDLDGVEGVAFADFLVLSGNFGKQVTTYEEGDIDCDGEVAFADFLVLSGNFGKTAGGAAAVPEPHTTVLLLPLVTALLWRRKRLA